MKEVTIGQITDELADIHSSTSTCLLSKGVNQKSFVECCGRNYEKLINDYKSYKKTLLAKIFENESLKFDTHCPSTNLKCANTKNLIFQKMEINSEMNKIARILKELCSDINLTSSECYQLIRDFQKSYLLFESGNVEISKGLSKTIDSVVKFIDKTGVVTEFDYKTVSPSIQDVVLDNEDLERIKSIGDTLEFEESSASSSDQKNPPGQFVDDRPGVWGVDILGNQVEDELDDPQSINSQIKDFLRENTEDEDLNTTDDDVVIDRVDRGEIVKRLKVNKNRFNVGLVREKDALVKLQFLLGSGRVDPQELDLSLLPSVLLQFIADNKLEGNGPIID